LRPIQEVFALRPLLGEAANVIAGRATLKGLKLALDVAPDVPELIAGDRVRLRQILVNLLENSLKFTSTGAIELAVSRGPSESAGLERIAYAVRDTGVGIPERGVERLFQPFVQGTTSASRPHGGTGLGLAIVRRLCEQMGGEIRAWRRPEGGSVFEAILPMTAADTGLEGRHTELAPPTHVDRTLASRVPLDVLVVDDDSASRELAVEQLRLLGYTPEAAVDARAALQMAERTAYDLVFLDVQMPDMDGWATAKALRALTRIREWSPRIVALSADVFAAGHADDSDFDAFITKPLSLGALQRFLEELGRGRVTARSDVAAEIPEGVLDQRVIRDLLDHRRADGAPLIRLASRPLLEQSESAFRELVHLVDSAQWSRAAALAHRLKGDCLLVGAARAAELAGAVSSAAQQGPQVPAADLLEALQGALEEARRAVRALIERPDAAPSC
jgi:CheY-like chemotaxis protein